MSDLNRRQFVMAAGAAVCCGLAGCASSGEAPWTGPMTFELPAPQELTKEGVDARWMPTGGFFLVRERGRLFAVSSTCSHKACQLNPKGAEYVCPCHGSRFTPAGKVLIGPATTSLVRFGISTNTAGGVVVDRNKTFAESQWDQPGAFLPV